MESLRKRAVEEVLRSEKSYLRHLEIIQEFFMQPIEDRKLLPQGDFAAIFGDLKSIIQVRVPADNRCLVLESSYISESLLGQEQASLL